MRRTNDWIEAFLDETSSIVSPEIFRRWAAISAVASALRRSSFTIVQGQRVFPNFYIMFVATPGVGKSNAIKHARRVAVKVPKIILSPQSLTEQSLYQTIESAGTRTSHHKDNWTESIESPLAAMIDEYGTLIKGEDSSFMDFLTDVYDCPEVYVYRTKTAGENTLEGPCLNLIGGCTPDWIRGAFTDAALERGFASRMILVYSDELIYQPLFGGQVLHNSDQEALLAEDLVSISDGYGEFTWSHEAALEFSKWHKEGLEPRPQDPRLRHYTTRRVVHMTKLCMVMRASRGEGKSIDVEDYLRAKEILLETETEMPKAVESLGTNPHYEQVKLIEALVKGWWIRNMKAMPEHELRSRIARDVASAYTDTLINSVVLAGKIRSAGSPGSRLFLPPEGWEPEPARGEVARATRRRTSMIQ